MSGETLDRRSAKRKSRLAGFSENDVRMLANAMREYPFVWKVSHTLHNNSIAVGNAWKNVAGKIKKSVAECKTAWIYLRESHRYHAKVAQKNAEKRNITGDYPIDWEYGDELDYLPLPSKKKKIDKASTDECSGKTTSEPDLLSDDDTQSSSKYSDKSSVSSSDPKSTVDVGYPDVRDLFDKVQNILQQREKYLQSECSKNAQALNTFDWLLNRLPDEIREKTCLEITSLLLDKIAELQKE